MTDLIIGGFTNYNYETVRPWVKSVIEATRGTDTHKVMCVGSTDQDTLNRLQNDGFELVIMEDMGIPVHVFRFVYIYQYLRNNWSKYRFVVTTDVRDVIFQSNPFDWLEYNLIGDHKMVAASESIRYMHEPWGNQNLYETYGPMVYEHFKHHEIYNVGTIGGDSEYVKDMVFNIATNAINRPIPIVDQAVFNVLIQTQPFKDTTLFAPQQMGWACQAGTTVDPHKIEYFRPNLLEAEPHYRDGIVYTSGGKKFAIVHQYDRVPLWKQEIELRYNYE